MLLAGLPASLEKRVCYTKYMNYLKNAHNPFERIIIGILLTSVAIPIVILDIWGEIYHRICFRLYGIPLVQRSAYIQIDRHKLKYLNFWQKWFCMYCGYANGVVHYWSEIAGQTEKYWCGIQHKKKAGFKAPDHHQRLDFADYGDEKDFKDKYHTK
jgi:hypothetical protein